MLTWVVNTALCSLDAHLKSKKIVALKPISSVYERLTASIVYKAQPGQKEYFVRDTERKGFFLRVRPSGVKSYGGLSRLARKEKR